jgi:hypothetical protein
MYISAIFLVRNSATPLGIFSIELAQESIRLWSFSMINSDRFKQAAILSFVEFPFVIGGSMMAMKSYSVRPFKKLLLDLNRAHCYRTWLRNKTADRMGLTFIEQ